jgi:DNA-directed RNA polymerase specialized sigma24 family protein
MTDEQLLDRGDFCGIVHRYQAVMLRIGRYYGLDAALAEDAVQEAFLVLYQQRASVRLVKQFLVTAVGVSAARFTRAGRDSSNSRILGAA